MDSLGNKIRAKRKEQKLTQQAVATALGISRVSVTQWELNETSPTVENLTALAKLLKQPLDYFSSNKIENSNWVEPNARIVGEVDFSHASRIPVYGQAVGGVDGEFVLNGNNLFDVVCPPQLQGVKNAYGVVVSGDSMSPRYFDGEVVYVNPLRRLKKGDFVVAQIMIDENSPPHAFVKRFCKHNAEQLVLEQFNPPKELKFAHERVVSVHFIAMSGEAE